MKKKVLWIAILCLSAAWLMAQQEPTSSGAQAGSSGQSATQSAPSGQSASPSGQSASPSGQTAAPSAQSGAAAQSAPGAAAGQGSDVSIMQGCLGGSQPNYTLTDKKGTTYKLVAPPNADVSVLSKHIGEPIAVMGTVNASGSSNAASSGSVASGSGASAASSSQPSIQVMKIGRGTAECPAGSGGATPKPQASKQ